MATAPYTLRDFAEESNRIEGISGLGRDLAHTEALRSLLVLARIDVSDLEAFVRRVEPDAFLRTKDEHRVVVGGHVAPSASVAQRELKVLLDRINDGRVSPVWAHIEYERIHPFIDGNGRSGRALWLWQMQGLGWDVDLMPRLFLQQFYYQTLSVRNSTT
jgi:hypothetical protein